MGNTISNETQTKMMHLIHIICSFECPIINMENRNGTTDYLDFIEPSELNDSDVVKGIDKFGRKLLVVKATFTLSNGQKIHSFSTFFQRYSDSQITWHCCGHYGLNLMNTEGSMELKQFEFLEKLLRVKEIELNDDIINEYRLSVYFNVRNKNNIDCLEIPEHIKAVKLTLGWL
jgi:hypothetical protein